MHKMQLAKSNFCHFETFLMVFEKISQNKKSLKHNLQLYYFLTNFQKALKMSQNGKKCDFANYILRFFSHFWQIFKNFP